MKTRILLVLLIPAAALAAGAGRSDVPFGPGSHNGPGRGVCVAPDGCPLNSITLASPTTLSPTDLVAGIEEERVARDLYTAAFERWGLPVFERIRDAEIQHEGAFVALARTINVSLPASTRGIYTTPELQQRYTELLSLVNQSLPAALRASALVEETDVAELRRLSASVTDDGTRSVLQHLEQASSHHLQAFIRNLARLGEGYQPQVLAADDFAAVINSSFGGGEFRSRGRR